MTTITVDDALLKRSKKYCVSETWMAYRHFAELYKFSNELVRDMIREHDLGKWGMKSGGIENTWWIAPESLGKLYDLCENQLSEKTILARRKSGHYFVDRVPQEEECVNINATKKSEAVNMTKKQGRITKEEGLKLDTAIVMKNKKFLGSLTNAEIAREENVSVAVVARHCKKLAEKLASIGSETDQYLKGYRQGFQDGFKDGLSFKNEMC